MFQNAIIVCVVFAATNSLRVYRSLLKTERLDEKLLQLRRMMLQQVVCLLALVVAAVVWLRGEEMHALRARALEAATVSIQSDVVHAIGMGVQLSAGFAAIVLLTLLPCIHVIRAVYGFVLDATQRRIAEQQVGRGGAASKA